MSEYQYYEFQAIDRPLTVKEMRELRSYSTRASITPTSFINEYTWGDFKGAPEAWMEKYFDAFLYFANWGTHILKLRLPSKFLDLKTAKQYCSGDSAVVHEKSGKVILTFVSENEYAEDWEGVEGSFAPLLQVRNELASGDLRALYLGWLLCVQNGELNDDELEPLVPPGLGELSAPLQNLVEFIRVDPNLLHIAAESSPPLVVKEINRRKLRKQVAQLPSKDKDELIESLILNRSPSIANELRQQFLKEQATTATPDLVPHRMVGELIHATVEFSEQRRRIREEHLAQEKARQERKAAIAREKYLDTLVGKELTNWTKVESLISTKQPYKYGLAVKILLDLRDLSLRAKGGGDFIVRLESLKQAHARKPAFLQRLKKAGL